MAGPKRAAVSSRGDDFFTRFLQWEAAGSVVLLAATIAALIWANVSAESYDHLVHTKVAVSFGQASFGLSLQHWINDLLMAVFFFVVGLEIKREVVAGELSSPGKALLPVLAAVGGLLVPAGVYAAFNVGGPGAGGWGVPMATDIAFAIGILALFGRRAPVGLKVFLTALAIADDVAAVLVIAIFYSESISVRPLLLAAVVLAVLAMVLKSETRRPALCTLLALGVWSAVMASRLHPTVAGILVAAVVPAAAAPGERSLAETLEEAFHPTVAFLIVPLFAFFNAGVALDTSVGEALRQPVAAGVLAGLVLGKQAGIMLFSWLPVKLGRSALPDGVTWMQIYGGACLAGIGFTMSLFITDLAFDDGALIAQAKVGIIVASLVAAVWAAIILHLKLPRVAPDRPQAA
jgi:NhaA family Na+:H+ antiporter